MISTKDEMFGNAKLFNQSEHGFDWRPSDVKFGTQTPTKRHYRFRTNINVDKYIHIIILRFEQRCFEMYTVNTNDY